jgi:hypothetical protein
LSTPEEGVPGRKLTLPSLRSFSRTSTSILALAVAVPALALAGIAASGNLSPTHPASQARAAGPARPAVTLATARPAGSSIGATMLVASGTAQHRGHSLSRNEHIAWRMMQRRFGWRPRNQFRFLRWLWERESSWNVFAENPYTGAYGIPQAVPGYKMSSAGRRWRTDASVQIRWGMRYIRERYGSPRGAWAHECAYGWY